MKKIKIVLIAGGDITKVKADAIVNAANYKLRPGKGVCGAIYAAAGISDLQAETDTLGPISTGTAVASGSYALGHNTKAIIHAVGPVWENGFCGEAILLKSAYTESLNIAKERDYNSIAFPCISTGVYGYPTDKAAEAAVSAVNEWLDRYAEENPLNDFTVFFVAFRDEDYAALADSIKKLNYAVEHKDFRPNSAQATTTPVQVTNTVTNTAPSDDILDEV